jgi:hypothetical protein
MSYGRIRTLFYMIHWKQTGSEVQHASRRIVSPAVVCVIHWRHPRLRLRRLQRRLRVVISGESRPIGLEMMRITATI